MKIVPTAIPEVLILEPKVFGDERGFFFESFNQRGFDDTVGRHVEFVQDNHSHSQLGVLRGLHYQLSPHAQGKLVRVARGRVFDVAVDVRQGSPTFGKYVGTELNASEHKQMWIPPGFAHGFLVLSDWADFLYKTTAYYAPEFERVVRWDDPSIGIDWPSVGRPPTMSHRDGTAPLLVSTDPP